MFNQIVMVLLAIVVVIQGAVLLELVRQFSQLRQKMGLANEARSMPAPVGMTIDVAVLPPEVIQAVERSPYTALLFLTDSCLTCHDIAEEVSSLDKSAMTSVEIFPILAAASAERAERFLSLTGLPRDAVVIDVGEGISDPMGRQVGLNVRPALVVLRGSTLWRVDVVTNSDQLLQVLKQLPEIAGVQSA